jgi:hypothetical protein
LSCWLTWPARSSWMRRQETLLSIRSSLKDERRDGGPDSNAGSDFLHHGRWPR